MIKDSNLMLRIKYSDEIEDQMKAYFDTLNEKDRRRYAAIEAIKLGHGGQNGSVSKNLAILQNQGKTSQMGYLYAINRSIMIQKAIVIAQKGSKIIFATEPEKQLI